MPKAEKSRASGTTWQEGKPSISPWLERLWQVLTRTLSRDMVRRAILVNTNIPTETGNLGDRNCWNTWMHSLTGPSLLPCTIEKPSFFTWVTGFRCGKRIRCFMTCWPPKPVWQALLPLPLVRSRLLTGMPWAEPWPGWGDGWPSYPGQDPCLSI